MKPRILKNIQTEYVRTEWTGVNSSGLQPLGKHVLILTDKASGITTGNVHLPDEFTERMNMAAESGVIVACGAEAFAYFDDGTKWTDYKPKPGDRVLTERYAGREFMGQDGLTYRLMAYTCIGGLEVPPEKTPAKKKG